MRRWKWKSTGFQQKLLFSFIALIAIPVMVVSLISYGLFEHNTKRELSQINSEILEVVKNNLGRAFANVENLAYDKAFDHNTLYFLDHPFSDNVLSGYDLINSLSSTVALNPIIDSMYIYDNKFGTIFSSQGKLDLTNYYDRDFLNKLNGNDAAGEVREWFATRKIGSEWKPEEQVVTFALRLPFGNGERKGSVVVNLKEQRLYDLISGLYPDKSPNIYIVDGSGTILSYSDKKLLGSRMSDVVPLDRVLAEPGSGYSTVKFEQNDYMVMYSPLGINDWRIIAVTPMDEYMAHFRSVRNGIIAVCLLLLAVSALISYVISWRMYRPFISMIGAIRARTPQEGDGERPLDDFQFIEQSFQSVFRQKLELQQALDKGLPEMRKSFLLDLLHGKNTHRHDIRDKMDYFHMDFSGQTMCVMIVRIDDFDHFVEKYDVKSRNLFKIALQNITEELFTRHFGCLLLDAGSHQLAFLLTCSAHAESAATRENVYQIAAEVNAAVAQYLRFTVSIGVGLPCSDLPDISQSYEEASEALWYKDVVANNSVVLIESMERGSRSLLLKYAAQERQLINHLKVGQKKEVEQLIAALIGEIVQDKRMTRNLVLHLFNRLATEAMQAIYEISGEPPEEVLARQRHMYIHISSLPSTGDIGQDMCEFLHYLIDYIASLRQPAGNTYFGDILAYIEEHYAQDLSLTEIAARFQLNQSYLSRIFKEQAGQNFVDYINRYRIDKGKELLMNSYDSVQTIAERIGYNNEQSFRRYFKKYEGVTPGDYRSLKAFQERTEAK